jgi:ribonuclease HII
VTRDRLMSALHDRWPSYGFDRHKGYACSEHRTAIAEHGVCALHRLSFNSVAYQQLDLALQ